MKYDHELDRCPNCKKNYIYGDTETAPGWITWYIDIYDAYEGIISIQILYCPVCKFELPHVK